MNNLQPAKPLYVGPNPTVASNFHSSPEANLPNPMPDLSEYMTTKEAAQALGFTLRGIQNLVRKSKLEAIQIGRMYLVSKVSVKTYREKTDGMSKNNPTRGKTED